MPGVAPFPSMNQNKPVVRVADTPQPIPTAGLLPVIERANINEPYSGGGGPSTIGPNPVFSTLTISPNGDIYFPNSGNVNGSMVGYLEPANSTPSFLSVIFPSGYAGTQGQPGLWCVGNQKPDFSLNNYGDLGAGRMVVLGPNAGTLVPVPVLTSDGNGGLELQAVSTINFSTPTLTLNGAPISGGSALSTFNQVFTSSIGVPLSANNTLTIIGPNANNNIVFNLPNETQSQIQFLTSTLVSGAPTVGAFIGADDLGGISQNLTIGTANPGVNVNTIISSFTLSLQAPTAVSSLSVSSINGAAPGGGYAPFFSTLNQSPSTINCEPGTSVLLSFSTTAGHLYQIQTQMTIQGWGGQEGTANDDVIQEVLNEINLNTTQGSFISTANAAARDVGIGTCGMWKSNLTGTSLSINGTFSTTIQLGDVFLTDFGPV